MKKIIITFLYGFGLNFIWENLHSFLYASYKGGDITELILTRAAIADSFIILALILILRIFKLSRQSWLLIVGGIIISILIELWAVNIGRWTYSEAMPLIPLIKTGLTPTFQIGILAYIVNKALKSDS